MTDNPLDFQISGKIGFLFLNRPPKNEMDHGFFSDLGRLHEEVLLRHHLKGLIISGVKNHFSSGANINELNQLIETGRFEDFRANTQNIIKLRSLPYPLVAAIKGTCFGSALELALACHFILAAPKAVFAFPEVTFQLIPGCGGTYLLPRRVGKSRAVELILSGRSLLADEALQIGLVDRIVPKTQILAEAIRLINLLNQRSE